MSYFIANTITISKDRKTFKAKGGDNNVVPRSNSWTRDIDIRELYPMISSGNMQFREKKDLFLLLDQLKAKYRDIYGGTWEDETEFYHEHNIACSTVEKLTETLERLQASTSYNDDYKKEKIAHLTRDIQNYTIIKGKVDNHIDMFLQELFDTIDQQKQDTDVYIVSNGYSYIQKLNRTTALTTLYKDSALKLNKLQAQKVFERFSHGGYQIIKL